MSGPAPAPRTGVVTGIRTGHARAMATSYAVERVGDPSREPRGRHPCARPPVHVPPLALAARSAIIPPMPSLRERVHDVIFEHERPVERVFDVLLIGAILLSVLVVMLDSVAPVRARYGHLLRAAEWAFTALFTVEYVVRVWAARRPLGYVTSFYGVIDLLSVLPTYLSLVFPAGRFVGVIRVLRVLRVFRVLKLGEYVQEASVLSAALRASRRKIVVFVYTVLTIVVVVGSLMYLIEGADSGFTSIPESVYWAIVTLTTVGYGDISPQTPRASSWPAC